MLSQLIYEQISELDYRRMSVMAPVVFERLKTIYPFASGHVIHADSPEGAAALSGLSKRQQRRASEAMSSNKGFWDRVGNRFLLPVTSERDGLTIVTLKDTAYKAMGPDEAKRWLPALKRVVIAEFRDRQLETAISLDGMAPASVRTMTCHILENSSSGKVGVLRISHGCSFAQEIKNLLEFIEGPLRDLANRSKISIEGASSRHIWCIMENAGERELALIVRSGRLPALMKRYKIISLHCTALVGSGNIDSVTKRINATERGAEMLGSSLFLSGDLYRFCRQTGVDDPAMLNEQIRKKVSGKRRSVVFVSADVLKTAHPCIDDVIRCGKKCSIILLRPLPERFNAPSGRWAYDIVIEIMANSAASGTETFNAGIASTWQSHINNSNVLTSALWAFIHATMLGRNKVVQHDATTWQLRGDELSAWNDHKAACSAYRKALSLKPESYEILNSLGAALATVGRVREAARYFAKAGVFAPGDFMIFYNLAGVLIKMNKKTEAVKAAERAVELAPDNPACIYRAAESLIASGKPEKAVNLIANLRNKERQTSAMTRLMVRGMMLTGQWKDAKRILEEALKENPDDRQALKLLSEGYKRFEKDDETAKRLLRMR